MLNREECDNALTRLLRPYFAKTDVQNVYHDINQGHSIDENSNLLTLLIMEHFSNPPLSFAEIQNTMWIWDKDEEEWLLVCNKWKEYDKEYLKVCSIYEYGADCKFEENRFYRKEVKN